MIACVSVLCFDWWRVSVRVFVLCKGLRFMVCRVCAVPDGCHFQTSSADALGTGLFFFQGLPRWHLGDSQPVLAQCKLSWPFRVVGRVRVNV